MSPIATSVAPTDQPSLQLKKQYGIVKLIKEKSGWTWNETRGAADVPRDAWDCFIEVSTYFRESVRQFLHCGQGTPDAKYFRTSGFPPYNTLAELVEGTVADGRHVVGSGKKRRRDDSGEDVADVTGAPSEAENDSDAVEEADSSQAVVSISHVFHDSHTHHCSDRASPQKLYTHQGCQALC